MSDDLLRQYRLGRLTETERHEIEQRAFEDDAFEDQLLEAESDLLDDWARGTLSAEDSAAVERAFASEQLAIARAIRREAAKPVAKAVVRKAPVVESGWPRWAVAAALVVGLLPSLYFWQRASKTEPAPVPPVVLGEVASLTLHVPTTRGAEALKVRVAATAQWVRVTLEAEAGYEFYEVRVESARTGLVFSQGMRGQPPLTLTIPANLLAAGEYDFVVSGRKEGQMTLLATYSCGVEK